jgi:hypothetical protein
MNNIHNQEKLRERARDVAIDTVLNGFKLLFVKLEPETSPTHAECDVEFLNANQLTEIQDDINNNVLTLDEVFSISGGSRITGGIEEGQVRVTAIIAQPTAESLRLRIERIGDYSTYTLQVTYKGKIDPVFSSIDFKFRPGCFNLNCAPEWEPSLAPQTEPLIDYLSRDFNSFKHVLINAMSERVPDWVPTSEADLDQVLIDLIAADADELSDFQDRVMNEAYLASARKRVSLARQARLMDYHIHPGNQAGAWLAVKVDADVVVKPWYAAQGFGVWTGSSTVASQAVIDPQTIFFGFVGKTNEPGAIKKEGVTDPSEDNKKCFASLNELHLYTWEGLVSALEKGATQADIAVLESSANETNANILRDAFRDKDTTHLLLEQKLNPETASENGRDVYARQIVQLLNGNDAAKSHFDPKAGQWFVRISWHDQDKLLRRFCFVTQCTDLGEKDDVSLFHGNLIYVAHGRPHKTTFTAPGTIPTATVNDQLLHEDSAHYEASLNVDEDRGPAWGSVCRLRNTPLAYLDTQPGGEKWTKSTLQIKIDNEEWHERSDLIESKKDDADFIVETDEYGVSQIRFGNSINGRALADDAEVVCLYQVGQGEWGNVGADKLTGYDSGTHSHVTKAWNPLDITNGRMPETPEQIIRRVPEAYRSRQLRAVTLNDYVKRAQELDAVDRAAAGYVWTGSWRAVRVAIDPKGSTEVTNDLRVEISRHLDAVRLIGDDIEIRPARYVPLDIEIRLCAHPDYWPEDLDVALQTEFSDGYTPDGRPGFFHPDQWSFGQPLYVSQITGRALSVTGIERLLQVNIRRFNPNPGPSLVTVTISPEDLPSTRKEKIEVDQFEIIQVENDPSRLETGRIEFDIVGGRA